MTKQEQIAVLENQQRCLGEHLEEYRLAYGLLADFLVDLKCARRDGLLDYETTLLNSVETVIEKARTFFR